MITHKTKLIELAGTALITLTLIVLYSGFGAIDKNSLMVGLCTLVAAKFWNNMVSYFSIEK